MAAGRRTACRNGRLPARLDRVGLQSQPGQVGALTAAGLGADAVQVGPDSADANMQLTGDLRIGVAVGPPASPIPVSLALSRGIPPAGR